MPHIVLCLHLKDGGVRLPLAVAVPLSRDLLLNLVFLQTKEQVSAQKMRTDAESA
jgi:hypothetical protein